MEDAESLLDSIAKGKLAELHLSHNQLNSKSIFEIVLAPLLQKTQKAIIDTHAPGRRLYGSASKVIGRTQRKASDWPST